MGRVGHNEVGKYINNKEEFCKYMDELLDNGEICVRNNMYCIDILGIEMDINTGNFANTTSGVNKANRRSYIKIELPCNKSFMCANYWFKVYMDAQFFQDRCWDKYSDWLNGITVYGLLPVKDYSCNRVRGEKMYGNINYDCVINHLNGNTEDNSTDNLEACTAYYNRAHANIMKDIHNMLPELSTVYINNLGKTSYSISFRIKSADIARYNEKIGYKNKNKNCSCCYYDYEQLVGFIEFIGYKANNIAC